MLRGYRNSHSVNRISRENRTIWFLFPPSSQPFKLRVVWSVLLGGDSRSHFTREIRRGCRGRFVGGSLLLLVLQVVNIGCIARLSSPFLGRIRLGAEEAWLEVLVYWEP